MRQVQVEPARRRRLVEPLLVGLLFILALVQYFWWLDETAFHPDESRWLNRAYYLSELFDPFGPTWNDRYLIRGQPPVGSYVMGAGLLLQGRDLDTNTPWDFHRSRSWNEDNGNLPQRADLLAGRRTNAVLGALAVVMVYFIGKRLSNRVGGVIGALFLIAHPLQIWHNNLALADTTLTVLLAAAIWTACRFAVAPGWRWAILLGVILGLAGANKLTPMALGIPLAVIALWTLSRDAQRNRRRPPLGHRNWLGLPGLHHFGWQLLAVPIISAAAFVASYPYLWPQPIRRTFYLLEFRQHEMENQARIFDRFTVDGPLDALIRTGHMLGVAWSSTRHAVGLVLSDSVATALAPLDLILAVVGLVILAGLSLRFGPVSQHSLALTLIGTQTLVILLTMRADFERYYLPIVLGLVICAGVAGGSVWSWLAPHFVRSSQRRQPLSRPEFDREGGRLVRET